MLIIFLAVRTMVVKINQARMIKDALYSIELLSIYIISLLEMTLTNYQEILPFMYEDKPSILKMDSNR